MKKIAVLTGAGISAESGISTFRDSNGLWENHNINDVATPEGWHRNPELVLRFYNARRQQLKTVVPNAGHKVLADMEEHYDIHIITQNVDDLHERAGSTKVMHLHGELRKVHSTRHPALIYPWEDDLHLGDLCEKGAQLRPHIVWFGESVPMIEPASEIVADADAVLIIGTSLQVYPAAGLMSYANGSTPIIYIDPYPQLNHELKRMRNVTVIDAPATTGVMRAFDLLKV